MVSILFSHSLQQIVQFLFILAYEKLKLPSTSNFKKFGVPQNSQNPLTVREIVNKSLLLYLKFLLYSSMPLIYFHFHFHLTSMQIHGLQPHILHHALLIIFITTIAFIPVFSFFYAVEEKYKHSMIPEKMKNKVSHFFSL